MLVDVDDPVVRFIWAIYESRIEDILTSNQFLSWRHTNLQERTSPIYSGITFHEWDAKHLPDEIIFSCSKFLIILHRFQMWNTKS